MPAPTDVSQLRAFLGLINFYGNFVKDLHDLRAPLDALTKKDAVYKWSPECKTSFNKRAIQVPLLDTEVDGITLQCAICQGATGHGQDRSERGKGKKKEVRVK
ncbi:hypothetical protein COOONC_05573 [Cooperia oncophora]